MADNFNLKEWMRETSSGPYKNLINEHYVDLKPITELSFKKHKDEEGGAKGAPGIPKQIPSWINQPSNKSKFKVTFKDHNGKTTTAYRTGLDKQDVEKQFKDFGVDGKLISIEPLQEGSKEIHDEFLEMAKGFKKDGMTEEEAITKLEDMGCDNAQTVAEQAYQSPKTMKEYTEAPEDTTIEWNWESAKVTSKKHDFATGTVTGKGSNRKTYKTHFKAPIDSKNKINWDEVELTGNVSLKENETHETMYENNPSKDNGFKKWLKSGNVIKTKEGYKEQSTQYKKVFKTIEDLYDFYKKEYDVKEDIAVGPGIDGGTSLPEDYYQDVTKNYPGGHGLNEHKAGTFKDFVKKYNLPIETPRKTNTKRPQ